MNDAPRHHNEDTSDAATTLRVTILETGGSQEYEYDADAELLWVTDFDANMNAVGKRHYAIDRNPINEIRAALLELNA